MKRAFFITGLEGSGTNMMAEVLVASGCKYVYEVDEIQPEDELIVIRRSWPHAGKWPDYADISWTLLNKGFTIHLLPIIRDACCAMHSVTRRDPSRDVFYDGGEEMLLHLHEAIENSIDHTTLLSYEAFTTSEVFRRWLFEERLGLPFPADYEVRNENLKHYEQ